MDRDLGNIVREGRQGSCAVAPQTWSSRARDSIQTCSAGRTEVVSRSLTTSPLDWPCTGRSLSERNPEFSARKHDFTAGQRQAGQPRDRRPAQNCYCPCAPLLDHMPLDADDIQVCGFQSVWDGTAVS